jgi:preprotein translocase subunit SecF
MKNNERMEKDEMSIINFSGLKSRPIATTFVLACTVIGIVWASVAKPWLVRELSADFATQTQLTAYVASTTTELTAMNKKLDKMASEDLHEKAYQYISNIEGEIRRHNASKSDNPLWLEESLENHKSLNTAISYKDCVLNNGVNCTSIKEQIW